MKYIEFKKRILSNIGADLLFLEIDELLDMEITFNAVVVDGQSFTILSANQFTLNVVANVLDSLSLDIDETMTLTTSALFELLEEAGIVINESLSFTANLEIQNKEAIALLGTEYNGEFELNLVGNLGTGINSEITIPLNFTTTMDLTLQGDVLDFSATLAMNFTVSTISLILADALSFSLNSTLTITNTISISLGTSLFWLIDETITTTLSLVLTNLESSNILIDDDLLISSSITAYCYRYATLNDYDSLTLGDLDDTTLLYVDLILD